MATIYLIQQVEWLGTNRYKIGSFIGEMVKYRQGTRFVIMMECKSDIESEVREQFRVKFKQVGPKDFEGNVKEMCSVVYDTISNVESNQRVPMDIDEVNPNNTLSNGMSNSILKYLRR